MSIATQLFEGALPHCPLIPQCAVASQPFKFTSTADATPRHTVNSSLLMLVTISSD